MHNGPSEGGGYPFFFSRTSGDSAKVKTTISSPVVVLISWCRLTTVVSVNSRTIYSKTDRAVSISWILTCLSKSLPFSAGSGPGRGRHARFQLEAEKRRSTAIAQAARNRAKAEENRGRLVLAEAEIPKALPGPGDS